MSSISWLWNMYVVSLHATLLLAGAALLARRAAPAVRAGVWTMAAPGLLVVTLLCYGQAGWGAWIIPDGVASPLLELGALATASHGVPADPAAAAQSSGSDLRWVHAARWVWMIGALLVLVRLAHGWYMVRALSRRANLVHDREWLRLLDQTASEMRVGRLISLRRSAEVATPLTWGTFYPTVLLPAAADEWPPEHRRAALVHELAHVRRNDSLLQLLSQLACAWYWFHPGVWWAARRLHAAREHACDAIVLQAGVRASDYAECLIRVADLAGAFSPRPVAVSVGMISRSRLKERLFAILDPTRRTPGSRLRTVATTLSAVALALALGSVRLSPHPSALWRAMDSEDWPMRAYAAGYLVCNDDPAVRAAVRVRAAADPHPGVRREVERRLARRGRG